MLFESLGQGWIFLLLLIIGAWCAVLDVFCIKLYNFWAIKLVQKKTINKQVNNNSDIKTKKSKKLCFTQFSSLLQGFFVFFKVLALGVILYLSIYFLDYGDVRFYHFIAFCGGFYIIKFLFAKWKQYKAKKCYNGIGGEQKDGKN